MMTSNIAKIVLVILFYLIPLSASIVTTKTVTTSSGSGSGVSREDAINNAITEAIGKIEGIKVNSRSMLKKNYIENSNGAKGNLIQNNEILKVTKGKADSYEINNISQNLQGLYEATVTIKNTKTTKKYKIAGMDNKRRSIAVIPISSQSGEILIQELVSALTKTRKFNILDRDNIDAYISEKRLILSGDTSQDELLKLGNVMGADYLVVSKLRELREIKKEPNKYISNFNSSSSYSINAIVEYRLIATATRQVKWSNTINEKYSIKADTPNDAIFQTLNKVAATISTQLIENIYPIRVISVSNNEATINQGSLNIGSKYDIFELGEKMYDPYTKESLGQQENKTGTIEIVRSTAKHSTGKIIDGVAKKTSVVRKSNDAPKKVNKVKRGLPY